MTHQLEFPGADEDSPQAAPETLTIADDRITATSPEGEVRSMELGALFDRVAPPRIDTCGIVLPDGVKCALPIPAGTILVHQTPPRVHCFEWIAADSPAPFGPGTAYRSVSIALPYLIVLAVFDGPPGAVPHLSSRSECFFSNRPLDLDGLDTQLCFPALLNCSRFPTDDASTPLSWICVQHLPPSSHLGAKTPAEAFQKGLRALLHHLLESAFNLSSEQHEVSSWFSETVTAAVDPRVASVEAWERASAENPLFALEVPWLPTKRTLADVAQRIADARGPRRRGVETARDLMRALFQVQSSPRRTR